MNEPIPQITTRPVTVGIPLDPDRPYLTYSTTGKARWKYAYLRLLADYRRTIVVHAEIQDRMYDRAKVESLTLTHTIKRWRTATYAAWVFALACLALAWLA